MKNINSATQQALALKRKSLAFYLRKLAIETDCEKVSELREDVKKLKESMREIYAKGNKSHLPH